MNIQDIVSLLRACERDTLGTCNSKEFAAAASSLEHYIPLATLGAVLLAEHRGPGYWDVGDVDGGYLQDKAVECGALIKVDASCTDKPSCACFDFGHDYCFHVPKAVRKASLELGVKQR